MNKRYEAILSILLNSQHALTRKELYEALEPSEQGLFTKGLDDISKDLDALKRNKKLVENGTSEIDSGKTMLTWLINEAGKKALAGLTITDQKSPDKAENQQELGEMASKSEQKRVEVQKYSSELRNQRNQRLQEMASELITMSIEDQAANAAPKVQDKAGIIDVLERVGALMADDIKIKLDYAAEVIGALEEVTVAD